jgi:hypothetical protein
MPWAGAVAAIAAVAGVVTVTNDAQSPRLSQRASRRFPGDPPLRVYTPRPDFDTLLWKKIGYLREDLRRYPHDQFLALQLTECYLLLAIHQREAEPLKAEQLIEAARRAVLKTDPHLASGLLGGALEEWRTLRWAPPGTTPLAMVFSGGMLTDPLLRMRSWSENSSTGTHGLVGNRGRRGMPSGPDPYGASGEVTTPTGGYGERAPIILPPTPHLREDERDIFERRTQLFIEQIRKGSEDPQLYAQLGPLLERLATRVPMPVNHPSLVEANTTKVSLIEDAVQLYRAAAQRPAPRYRRAAFLVTAANVYNKLGNQEREYALLLNASWEAPYDPNLWYQLYRAALRTGRVDKSRRARFEAMRWRFPSLQRG